MLVFRTSRKLGFQLVSQQVLLDFSDALVTQSCYLTKRKSSSHQMLHLASLL
jgi:hypothetical protein